MEFPLRINKYLRDTQATTRKKADELVSAGRVLVNGSRAVLGMQISASDKVEVRGEKPRSHAYLAYYKPRGLPTQAPKGVASVITEWAGKGLFPIGRLDKESEGLLILTDDGRVANWLLGAKSGVEKEYLVKVREKLRAGVTTIFSRGMNTEPFGKLLPAEAKILAPHLLSVILHEGKKHQIRVMLAELGYTIERLKRVRVGKFQLKNLKPGETRKLDKAEWADFFGAQ